MAVKKIDLDKVGACASAVCAVHCFLTGFALSVLSIMGLGFFENPILDYSFVGVAAFVGAFALYHGIRKHKSFVPALFFVMGLLAIGMAHFIGHSGRSLITASLSVIGGLCLVLFHVLNLRLQKAIHCCGEGKICTHSSRPSEEIVG